MKAAKLRFEFNIAIIVDDVKSFSIVAAATNVHR
jgi:hypothetical protein